MSVYEKSLKLHMENKGKIEVISKVNVTNGDELSLAYSPGVAEPCRKISENKSDVYKPIQKIIIIRKMYNVRLIKFYEKISCKIIY